MSDRSPFEEDVFLKGTITVIVRNRQGRPCAGQRLVILGCGFV